MSRRKKGTPIPVEDSPLDDLRVFDVLRALSPDSFAKVHAAAHALVQIARESRGEVPYEPDHEFRERLRRINPEPQEVN